MKIEFSYTTDRIAHMEMDAEALRSLEGALIDNIVGGTHQEKDLIDLCLCVTEIVHALDRLSEQEPEEKAAEEAEKAEKETTE